ncbi:glycosyl hydrolase 108 family protein [Kamptonema formosum]|uniref:glycosyl hydrolase 108 family protein n=1 Tax=Kamptonema formosum TaxID=331992 RepID=UPI0003476143|nr:glycosyl hydrolase 108 family protein [Oscillatoria sp. PCC 10802]
MKLATLVKDSKVLDWQTLGSDHELVREIQKRLSEIGLLKESKLDGSFDPLTQAAIIGFSQNVFLDNGKTGLFGPTFAKKLIELSPTVKTDENSALEIALKFTLQWEGGYVNHPIDLGGPTNKGITQATYNSYRSSNNLPYESVKFITDGEVYEIYSKRYWQRSHAELMETPLAVVQFDTAVMFGVKGAIQFLQEALGVTADGIFGTETEMAWLSSNSQEIALQMIEGRIRYHKQWVKNNPEQEVFLAGWLNRAENLREFLLNL